VPEPVYPMPVASAILSLLQLYEDPLPLPLIVMELMLPPEQMVWVEGVTLAVLGLGNTVTNAVMAVPVHPLTDGVMVNITFTWELVVFVKMPEILPVPEDGMPVTDAVLFLVHEKVVLEILLVNKTGDMAVPEQTVCVEGVAVAVGLGLTRTEALLEQLFVVGVMVKVTYNGEVVVLVNVPLMVPEPLFAIPVTPAVLFLVQL
jgi:hypothetical protein